MQIFLVTKYGIYLKAIKCTEDSLIYFYIYINHIFMSIYVPTVLMCTNAHPIEFAIRYILPNWCYPMIFK